MIYTRIRFIRHLKGTKKSDEYAGVTNKPNMQLQWGLDQILIFALSDFSALLCLTHISNELEWGINIFVWTNAIHWYKKIQNFCLSFGISQKYENIFFSKLFSQLLNDLTPHSSDQPGWIDKIFEFFFYHSIAFIHTKTLIPHWSSLDMCVRQSSALKSKSAKIRILSMPS